MSSKKYIFLSYSRKDYDFAMQLKEDLENAGFDVWVDQNKIVGGEVWRKSIADALKNSHTVVWVVSPDSVNSKYVNKELSFADGKDVCIIPVVYRKAEIGFPFHELQFVDVSGGYVAAGLYSIVESIMYCPTGMVRDITNESFNKSRKAYLEDKVKYLNFRT